MRVSKLNVKLVLSRLLGLVLDVDGAVEIFLEADVSPARPFHEGTESTCHSTPTRVQQELVGDEGLPLRQGPTGDFHAHVNGSRVFRRVPSHVKGEGGAGNIAAVELDVYPVRAGERGRVGRLHNSALQVLKLKFGAGWAFDPKSDPLHVLSIGVDAEGGWNAGLGNCQAIAPSLDEVGLHFCLNLEYLLLHLTDKLDHLI